MDDYKFKMQFTMHFYWSKSVNILSNGFFSGLIPVMSNITKRKCCYFCANKIFLLDISRQFHISTSHLSTRNKKYFVNNQSSGFNVKSLWDIEEKKKNSSEHKIGETFESSHLKRDYVRQERLLFSKLEERVGKEQQIRNKDWEEIKSSILAIPGTIDEENVDAIIMNNSAELSLSLCKSYFKYLKYTKKRINRATYGNYLRAFYNFSSSCTNDDLREILDVYNELLTLYPILDFHTAEKVVFAISLTQCWKNYDRLFRDIKQFYNPSWPVYSVVIKTSFRNGEVELGWELIDEMLKNCGRVSDDVFQFWLEKNNTHKDLLRVLNFFSKCSIMPSSQLCEVIMKTFNEFSAQGKGKFSTISKSGECKHCNSKLERAWVSEEDYNQLKSAFLNPVLIGKDIFLKTQPEEFKGFLQFLERTTPYDIVLDGLNIAFKIHKSKRTQKMLANQLKSVVRHFAAENKKILVLGRKHMRKWPKEELKYIEDNAFVFLADDVSQDDPFLLYATLYSGIGTCFVSQDMMRGHKFLLGDPKLKNIFQKWQSQHQYMVVHIQDNGIVHLKDPVPFLQTIQQNSYGDWHIPYVVKEELSNKSLVDNYHKHWLCLTNRALQPTERWKENEYQRKYTPQKKKIWEEKAMRKGIPRIKFEK